jgi:hypothetical protein
MLIGAGQESLVAGDDQMRIFLAQFVGAKTLLVELTIAEILEEHIGAFQQPVHGLAILGLGEVEHDAALAAVEQRKERGSHAAERAGLVARGRLDLDHLGAELGEDHAAGWAHHHVGHLDDPHALERQSGLSHALLLFLPPTVALSRAIWKI